MPSVLADLASWREERIAQGAKPGGHFVCAMSRAAFGKPLDRRNLRARFISSCRALGPERQAHLTIHDGRHTCASHLLAGGWALPAVRDALGHANISTTSVYSHIGVDEDEEPNDVFDF
jgi:integrase